MPGSGELADRLQAARLLLCRLLADHDPARVAVAWTGGKDSTLALWLWRSALAEQGGGLTALSLDTGCKFPEVQAFRDELARTWGVLVHVVQPSVDMATYPVAQDPLSCCRDLKVEPLGRAVRELGISALVTGIRRDEHPSRAGRQPLEARHDPEYLLVNPLLDFTEMDVWSVITSQGLPYCSLYDQGYRSLGCMPCTAPPLHSPAGERGGRDGRKEAVLAQLSSLGYF